MKQKAVETKEGIVWIPVLPKLLTEGAHKAHEGSDASSSLIYKLKKKNDIHQQKFLQKLIEEERHKNEKEKSFRGNGEEDLEGVAAKCGGNKHYVKRRLEKQRRRSISKLIEEKKLEETVGRVEKKRSHEIGISISGSISMPGLRCGSPGGTAARNRSPGGGGKSWKRNNDGKVVPNRLRKLSLRVGDQQKKPKDRDMEKNRQVQNWVQSVGPRGVGRGEEE